MNVGSTGGCGGAAGGTTELRACALPAESACRHTLFLTLIAPLLTPCAARIPTTLGTVRLRSC